MFLIGTALLTFGMFYGSHSIIEKPIYHKLKEGARLQAIVCRHQ
jgi:hypothetical protein